MTNSYNIERKYGILKFRNQKEGQIMFFFKKNTQKQEKTAETEEMRRMHRCAFTGHRPEKLRMPEQAVKAALEHEIRKAIQDGYHVFISGMARGVDIWAAEIVLALKGEYGELKLICAVPYDGFELRWARDWQERYNHILQHADYVRILRDSYTPSVFQYRNMWMVNHSARLIAVYNGEAGGTRNTIQYAKEQGRVVRIVQ